MATVMTRRHLLQLAGVAALPLAPAASAAQSGHLRSALCAYSFRTALQKKTMSYEDLVRLAADLGVDGLDTTVYWFPDTSDQFLYSLKRTAYRNGIDIYSIAVRTVMTQPTAEGRDKEVASVHKWVDVAEKLGARHIRVFGGDVPKDQTEEAMVPHVVETLKRSAEYAATKGVMLGLENHGGITANAPRILEILKKVDSPWVGVNLDTGNFKKDVIKQIAMILPQAINVQVKAEMMDESGQMVRQDWSQVFKMIRDSGYRGYLSLEYEAKEPAETAVPRLIKEMKEKLA